MWISEKDSVIGSALELTGNFEEHMKSEVVNLSKP
jgi:hypothetical protein